MSDHLLSPIMGGPLIVDLFAGPGGAPDECWEGAGSDNGNGYRTVRVNGRNRCRACRQACRNDTARKGIGRPGDRTETFEIIAAAPDSPIGWGYRDVRGAKTRYVVITEAAEADPDASVLATIRESLDAADLNEVDEMSRRVLAGLRAAEYPARIARHHCR